MKATIPIGEFKTHCYQILDQAQKEHKSVIVTRKGKPIAKLSPIDLCAEEDECFFDSLKDSVSINSDIISPIDSKWDVCDE
jgi:prevent-host-death family protein